MYAAAPFSLDLGSVSARRRCLRGWLLSFLLHPHGVRPNLSIHTAPQLIRRDVKVVVRLQAQPRLRRGIEVASQAKRGLSGDAALAEHDLVVGALASLDHFQKGLHRCGELTDIRKGL